MKRVAYVALYTRN